MATIKPSITQYISPLERGKVRDVCSPFLQELALVVITWNELHIGLSRLFCLAAGFTNMLVGLEIWHSTENDRAQRKMLRVALKDGFQDLLRVNENDNKFLDRARKDITFILNKVDAMAENRNNAIHSPCLFAIEGNEVSMQSFDFFQSPRAEKLKGKDLLMEFRSQTESYGAISIRAEGTTRSLSNSGPRVATQAGTLK